MKHFLRNVARRFIRPEVRVGRSVGGSLSNPPNWLERVLLGFTSDDNAAGIEVTERNALAIAAVWACVRAIAEDVAKLPVCVHRRTGERTERLDNHPVRRLLSEAPNPEMTSFDFFTSLTGHLLLGGNCMAEIVRMGNGRPAELWPMEPDRTQVLRDNLTQEIIYVYANPRTNRTVTLQADEVLHVKGLGYDGLLGYSVVGWARQSMALTAATERFGASFFGNSSLPRGILEHPGELGEDGQAALRKSWEETHKGTKNGNRIGILEEGMKFHALTIPPEEAQFLETRQFQLPEICRWFRMPPHKIADLSHATYSNIEHAAIEYVGDTIVPWLVRWEQEIRRKLFMQSEANLYARFDTAALLRGDIKARYDAYAVGRQWGWLSADDVRSSEGMNPLDKGGDIYLIPENMRDAAEPKDPEISPTPGSVAEKLQLPAPDKPPSDQTVEAVRSRFEEFFFRHCGVEVDKLSRGARREDRAAWFPGFVDRSRRDLAAQFTGEVVGAVLAFGAEMNRSVPMPIISAVASDIADKIARRCADRLSEDFGPSFAEGWEFAYDPATRSKREAATAIETVVSCLTSRRPGYVG